MGVDLGAAVAVGVAVAVGEPLAVGVAVAVGEPLAVGVAVAVGVTVADAVGVGLGQPPALLRWYTSGRNWKVAPFKPPTLHISPFP